MFISDTVKLAAGFGDALPPMIAGLIVLPVAILLLTRPRRSGDVWRKITQATRPRLVSTIPTGAVIAVGCLAMMIAVGSLSAGVVVSR